MARKISKRSAKTSDRIAGSPKAARRAGRRGDEQAALPDGDVALVVGRNADGVHIIRRRSQEAPLEAGLLRPMQEGKPISGEVVSLTPRSDAPLLFDVKSEYSPADAQTSDAGAASGEGPAQVASEAYRRGWDAVWGGRHRDRSLN